MIMHSEPRTDMHCQDFLPGPIGSIRSPSKPPRLKEPLPMALSLQIVYSLWISQFARL